MTSLEDWVAKVELDVPSEAEGLYNAIDTLQGSKLFSVGTKMENGVNIPVITKNGFRQILEIKSDLARKRILKDISDDYLPLKKLR